MNDHYNIFGNYISNKNIETFDDEVDYSQKINELRRQIKSGDIKEEEMKEEILKLKKLYKDGKLSESDEKAFKNMLKKSVRLTDGINLVGNLELGGIIKARGFHLADGTEIKTITQHKDKLAVPLDKDGNVHIKPNPGKKMKIDKTDVNELNIPKSGKITFGAGEDNDPYHLKKFGDKDNNHLRLTLNDNANESLQVWGNSCKTDKCNPEGGSVAHIFDSNGNVVHHGSLKIKNAKNKNNPTGYATHFNYKKQGKNYIRGNTQVDGKLCVKEPGKKKPICVDSNLLGSTKTMNVKGNANVKGDLVFNGGNNWIMHTPDDKRHTLYIAPSKTKGKGDWNWPKQTRFESNGEVVFNEGKHGNYNRTGWATHFNHKGQGLNYIRGQTELRGEVNFVDSARGVNIYNAKNGNNPSGRGTHFNYGGQGLNYIRGKTEMRGEVNFVDSARGVNIYNAKNGNNPSGGWTQFNYRGQGLNYIRGKTEMRGEVNYVDRNKGINISNAKNGNNPSGGGTHFNYRGQGLNYIRGKTEMRGETNFVDKTKGINISNPKNGDNPTGGGTLFNYRGRGHNYIRGKTEIRGELNVDSAKGINIYNGKSKYNPNGYATHFNYQAKGLNYIRGQTEIRGPQVNVVSNSGVRVHGHGKLSSFGSLNSGWCHLITNASHGFYFNNGVQVNGVIRGYYNKPIHADKGIRIGNINLYERGGRLFIDAPVTINNRQGSHGSLNIRRTGGDNSDWNYIQFQNKRGQRTAWGGSRPGRRFGYGR